jgi:DNA-binding transcriptional MerR regulator
MSDTLDINALSRETGVNVRTIRYYLAEGLLPPPAGRGPAAVYGPGHRDRLRLIRRLQDAHQPLAAIRVQLESLDDAGVAAALGESVTTEKASEPATAYDYVRQVLGKPPRQGESSASVPRPDASGSAPSKAARQPTRSNWERIVLHPDIELHVRRPLARSDQRRLDELLEQAQRLFNADL